MKSFECDHCGKVVENPRREDIHWMPDEVTLETNVATVCSSCVGNFDTISQAFSDMTEEEQRRDYMILWIQNNQYAKSAVVQQEPQKELEEVIEKEEEETSKREAEIEDIYGPKASDLSKVLEYDDSDIQVVPFKPT